MAENLITAYAGLQQQLEQLSNRLAILMRVLPAGVLVIAPDGRIAQANPTAEALLSPALEGATWSRVASRLQLDLTAGEALVEVGHETRRLALSHTRIGPDREHIILLHDITDTHRLRRAAERQERMAAMGEMVASLAHQLRTPLAAALLYVGSLRQAPASAADRDLRVARAVERLQHLERLIRDMLHFTGPSDQPREDIPVDRLVAEVVQTLAPVARARGVALTRRGARGSADLHGERKALAGALTSLLENALQATPAGGRVRLLWRGTADHLVFRVTDTGPGVPAAHQARIFEPFYTTRPEGTGLGLAIARSVARAHGGDLACRTAPWGGAVFDLHLPRPHPGATLPGPAAPRGAGEKSADD